MKGKKRKAQKKNIQINEISKLKKISKDDDLEDVARDKLGMIKSNEIIYLDSSERGN